MPGRKAIDLTGQRFGRLTVLRREARPGARHAVWLCVCDCEEVREVESTELRRGHTVSCGCYSAEQSSKRFTERNPSRR